MQLILDHQENVIGLLNVGSKNTVGLINALSIDNLPAFNLRR